MHKSLVKRSGAEETTLYKVAGVYASEIQNITASYLSLIADQRSNNKAKLFAQAATLLNGTDTCGSFITPTCLKALYNIPESTLNDSVNTLGLYESEYQLWDREDLDSFFDTFFPNATDGKYPFVTSINNATSEGPTDLAGGEAVLELTLLILSYIHSLSECTRHSDRRTSTKHIMETIGAMKLFSMPSTAHTAIQRKATLVLTAALPS